MKNSMEETKFSNYFKLPNSGLRAYFERVVKGQPEEYRTTFYGKNTPLESILKGWEDKLVTIADKWPSLFEFENDLRSKVGPMSIMLPLKERMKDIDHYYDDILLPSKPIDSDAIQAVVSEFGSKIGGLRARSVHKTVERMKLSTNSGNPYFTKRSNVLGKSIPDIFGFQQGLTNGDAWYYRMTELYSRKLWNACAVLGWRGQEGGPEPDDVKQRIVWMFPFMVNIAELTVYQPLIEGVQRTGLVPAWISMEAVDKRITDMFDTKDPEDLVICTDFSKFDQHFNRDMQRAAEVILRNLLSEDKYTENWLDWIFNIKYSIPLAYDYDKIRFGNHGMASGSGGTNADETLVHRALQHEAALAHGSALNPNSQCLGDDGVLTYPGITVEDVVQTYSRHGQEMNLDKQYASKQDCTYLRRWHHKDYRINDVCVGVYSTYRALGRLAEQERYYDPDKWNSRMVALRQLSIIENCKYHPLREEFADYCMKGDKYRLGIDIPGFLDDIEAIAREATELLPDFLGYTKSMQNEGRSTSPSTGISNWWIVNYLKSKK